MENQNWRNAYERKKEKAVIRQLIQVEKSKDNIYNIQNYIQESVQIAKFYLILESIKSLNLKIFFLSCSLI